MSRVPPTSGAPRSRALAALAAIALLAGCTAGPAPETPRAAPVVLPEGYTDPAEGSPDPDCGPPPQISLNPALLDRSTGRPEGPTLRRIRDGDRKLVVGVSQTGRQFSSRDLVTGTMSGFEVDIVKRIATELFGPLTDRDPRLQLQTLPTGSRLYALRTEKNRVAREDAEFPQRRDIPQVDMVIADVSITCYRVDTYGLRYSTAYLATTSGLLVRKGTTGVTTPEDLAGRKVCSGTNTTNSNDMVQLRDQQHKQRRAEVIAVTVADTSDCLMLLQRGLIDAVYSDVLILEGFRKQDPGTVILEYRAGRGALAGIAMAGSGQDDLVRFVNDVLAKMRADGSLQRSYDKWFADVNPRLPLPAAQYLD